MRNSDQNKTGTDKYNLFRKHLVKTQWSLIFFTIIEVTFHKKVGGFYL